MTLYPEVQKRAQHELDTVVGRDRLPTLADRDRLPYLQALCLEVLRWMPAAPLGTSALLRSTTLLSRSLNTMRRYTASSDRR